MGAPAAAHLTLIVPGLFGPAPPEGTDPAAALEALVSGLDLEALETLLSRARSARAEGPWGSPEDLLFSAFGYLPSDGDWPAAAVTRAADIGEDEHGWYLRADPVHLKADLGDLVLFDGSRFSLDLKEARELAELVSAHFADAGWRIEVPHPLRWYLRPAAPARIRTVPLSMARRQTVDAHLPAGEEAGRWHGLLNETQMLLHDCAANDAREARGEPAVNSLWFWGGGTLPPAPAADWSQVCGDSALLEGLAGRAGIPWHPIPDDPQAWLDDGGGRRLLYIDDGHAPARSRDVEAWREFIAGSSAEWFAPLLDALDGRRLGSVSVLTDRKLRYHVGRARWWRRLMARRTFSRLAHT